MLVNLQISKRYKLKDIYELMHHGPWLFCKCVVGLRLSHEIHKKGFVYQFIRDGEEEFHFIYTRLRFSPFIWSEKKLDTYLQNLFSFVPKEIIITDHTPLERFNKGLQVEHLSYPTTGRLPQDEEGVFYILPSGRELHLKKGKGKPLPKKATLTLFHPLCPLPALL